MDTRFTTAMILTLSIANLGLAQRDLRYQPINVNEGGTGSFSCDEDEILVGVSYSDFSDKSILGLWCTLSDHEAGDRRYLSLVNGKKVYDILCARDEVSSGFMFKHSFGKASQGMYCSKSSARYYHTYYVPVMDQSGSHYDVFCDKGSVLIGVRYRKNIDDTIVGLFCGRFQ